MRKFLERKITNKIRQKELDIARGLAVLFMVFIHIQQYFANESVQYSWIGGVIDFLGGIPAAPVFMFLLGVGTVYTSKNEPKLFIKRGLMLILAGYILNILRGVVPNLVGWYISGYEEYLYQALSELIYVDIFQFSGLAFILFGIFKYTKANFYIIVSSIIIFPIINLFLLNVKISNYYLSAITGLFWGSNELSFFPFLSWIFYPLAGYVFGTILVRIDDKSKFYRMNLLGSAILLVIIIFLFGYFLGIELGLTSEYAYYHHKLISNIFFTDVVILWISILYFISDVIPKGLYYVIELWSKNVTEIYFIHWIIIGSLVKIIGYNSLDMIRYLAVVIGIFTISYYLSILYERMRKYLKEEREKV